MKIEKAIIWCDRIMAFAVYGVAYFIPISIALVESFFGLALATYFIKRGLKFYSGLVAPSSQRERGLLGGIKLFFKTFKPVASPLNWAMAVFILSGFLSLFVSLYPSLSFKGFFFKLLEWTYLYFIVIEAIASRKQLKILMGVMAVSAIIACINGVVQHFTGYDFIWHRADFSGRISSSFRHPNDFGSYLIVICSFLFSFLWLYPGELNQKWSGTGKPHPLRLPGILWFAVALIFFLAVYNLGLTYSRGAWIAFFAALMFLGVQRGWLIFVPVVAIVLFMNFFSPGMEEHRKVSLITDDTVALRQAIESNDSSPASKNQNQTPEVATSEKHSGNYLRGAWDTFQHFRGSGRTTFWEESISIIRRSPYLGNGVNTYAQLAKGKGGYPHNCYLQLTAEMGFLGLFAFMWMQCVLIGGAARALRRISDGYLSFILAGATAGLIAFLVQSFVDTNFYSVQLGNLMWITMGIIVASQKADQQLKDHA